MNINYPEDYCAPTAAEQMADIDLPWEDMLQSCKHILTESEWDNLHCNQPDCILKDTLCCQIHRIHLGIDPYYYSNYNTYYNKKKGK